MQELLNSQVTWWILAAPGGKAGGSPAAGGAARHLALAAHASEALAAGDCLAPELPPDRPRSWDVGEIPANRRCRPENGEGVL